MAVYNNAALDNVFASDAEWRTWCQAIETALLASGFLVAASDTGQIDLTTAVRPAINTAAGYKIYKANDALQASKPFFLKVQYGVGSAITMGRITLQMSSATNGAGTPSGLTSSTFNISATTDGSGAARLFASGDASSVWIVHWDGTAAPTQSFMFFASRSRLRSDMSATDDFVMYGYTPSSNTVPLFSCQKLAHPAIWDSFLVEDSMIRADGASNTGGDVSVSYLFDAIIYRAGRILTLPFVYGRQAETPYTDPAGGAYTLTVWGAVRTFTPIPWTAGFGVANAGRASLLWEV